MIERSELNQKFQALLSVCTEQQIVRTFSYCPEAALNSHLLSILTKKSVLVISTYVFYFRLRMTDLLRNCLIHVVIFIGHGVSSIWCHLAFVNCYIRVFFSVNTMFQLYNCLTASDVACREFSSPKSFYCFCSSNCRV